MGKTRVEQGLIQELHKITSGEVTAGYFTLPYVPDDASSVQVFAAGGPEQINKDCVGSTGEQPDFQLLNNNQVHFNNNGGATGLSGHIKNNSIVVVVYDVDFTEQS